MKKTSLFPIYIKLLSSGTFSKLQLLLLHTMKESLFWTFQNIPNSITFDKFLKFNWFSLFLKISQIWISIMFCRRISIIYIWLIDQIKLFFVVCNKETVVVFFNKMKNPSKMYKKKHEQYLFFNNSTQSFWSLLISIKPILSIIPINFAINSSLNTLWMNIDCLNGEVMFADTSQYISIYISVC